MALGAHLAVEIFELHIGFLKLLRAAHHGAGLVSDAPISVSAPQPTMVKHISETIRTMLSSTPPSSILRTSSIITTPAMISSTLMAMDSSARLLHLKVIVHLFPGQIEFHARSLSKPKIPCDALPVTARDFSLFADYS